MKFPKNPFPKIEVWWLDPQSHSEWTELSNKELEEPALCHTIGFLVHKTKERIVIASDLAYGDHKQVDSYGSVITIPVSIILSSSIKL
jgi:hypothetical protein